MKYYEKTSTDKGLLWSMTTKGFTMKDWRELLTKFKGGKVSGVTLKDVDTKVKQEFGKIRRYKNEYNKSVRMIEHYTELRDKYYPLLVDFENRYNNILKFVSKTL